MLTLVDLAADIERVVDHSGSAREPEGAALLLVYLHFFPG